METIKGRCFTTLDDYEMKVTEFYRVPNIGERVMCLKRGYDSSLKVNKIIHDIKDGKPFIIVELHN